MIQINTPMPNSCSGCFAFDDNGDYPTCIITQHSRGYNFNIHTKRMPDCPLTSRPKGRWILSSLQDEEDSMNGNYLYECSNCDAADLHSEHVHVPYCWHCGAEMEDN